MSLLDELSPQELNNYTAFINSYLNNEEKLGGISKRLQNNGVSPELARELVRHVALSHSDNEKGKATTSLVLGGIGLVVFSTIGIVTRGGAYLYIASFFSFFGGIYQYRSSKKRFRYLTSISNK
jgi:hypothetical protein